MWGHPNIWECPHIFRGHPNIGVPPVYTQHKESMLCQTKGVSICPMHLDAPISLDTPICLNGPLYVWMTLYVRVSPMFECPLYAWTTPICLDAPIYLDDVWMPPVYTQHKESMLCQTKGVSICPIHVDAPICLGALCMFGCPTVCLDAAKCMVASKGMRDIRTYGGVQTYRVSSKCMEAYAHPQSKKACFLCVVYLQQASKHLPYIWGHPNIGVPKYTGEYPNIWGIQIYSRVSKHGGIPNI